MARMEVGDLSMNVRRIGVGPGNGPTVVMIHGLSADNLSSLYYTLAPSAARTADVILYDLRGHGRTDRPATGYGLDDSLQDLLSLLAALDVDGPIHIVGHSYGGAVALAHAVARPEQTASLVLLEGCIPKPGWGEYMAASIAFLAYSIEKPEVLDWMRDNGGRKGNRAMDDVRALIHQTSLVHDIEHRTRAVTEEGFRAITVPTLAIYGEHSDVIDEGREATGWMPEAVFETIAGHDHSLLLPCADLLGERLAAWLDQVRTGRRLEPVRPAP